MAPSDLTEADRLVELLRSHEATLEALADGTDLDALEGALAAALADGLSETNVAVATATFALETLVKRRDVEAQLGAAVAARDEAAIEAALHAAATAGLRPHDPCVARAIEAKQAIATNAAATTLQGARRKQAARHKVAKIRTNEEIRKDLIRTLSAASADACAALERARCHTTEPHFQSVMTATSKAIELLRSLPAMETAALAADADVPLGSHHRDFHFTPPPADAVADAPAPAEPAVLRNDDGSPRATGCQP